MVSGYLHPHYFMDVKKPQDAFSILKKKRQYETTLKVLYNG